MKSIPLTRGKFALVDDEDYEYLNQWKWFCAHGRAVRGGGYKKKSVFMHRVILNTPDGYHTDHIDSNPLNNQKSNLRVCTIAENNRNQGRRKDNRSGYKGVNMEYGRWVARIRVNGEAIRL